MSKRRKYEWRRAKLQCNECGNQFEDRVLHVAIEGERSSRPLAWMVESYSGPTCPSCASRLIGPQR